MQYFIIFIILMIFLLYIKLEEMQYFMLIIMIFLPLILSQSFYLIESTIIGI